MVRPPVIATGVLWQETNSFNPLPTGSDDFILSRGEALLSREAGSETSLGGILGHLQGRARIAPVLAARARPGGPVDATFMRRLEDEMVSGILAARPDAVCLELHGAMFAEDCPDPEGRLLTRLRAALGPAVPITVAMDLHGHMTPEIFDACDLATAYRTQPHRDMRETGERAARHALDLLGSAHRPAAAMRSVPMIALTNDETSSQPLFEIHRRMEEQGSGLVDWSLFNTHPFLDVAGIGQVALGYAESEDQAQAFTEEAASLLWTRRVEFLVQKPGLETLPRLVSHAKETGRLLVIGDEGDSVLAGTTGDSTQLGHALLGLGAHALIPVYAPEVVAAATRTGVGGRVTDPVGGRNCRISPPLDGPWQVMRLTDGKMVNEGHYMRGLAADLGPCAILRRDTLTVLATTRAPSVVDPCLIRHALPAGPRPEVLVVKASNHYKLSFGAEADLVTLATSGFSARDAGVLPHRVASGFFPLDRDARPEGRTILRTAAEVKRPG